MTRLLSMSVKILRELANRLAIDKLAVVACTEKNEICRLIHDQQRNFAEELISAGVHTGLNAYNIEWDHAHFASYWGGLKDLKRTLLFRHELVGHEWGMYVRDLATRVENDELHSRACA
jgi:hypothetical protein